MPEVVGKKDRVDDAVNWCGDTELISKPDHGAVECFDLHRLFRNKVVVHGGARIVAEPFQALEDPRLIDLFDLDAQFECNGVGFAHRVEHQRPRARVSNDLSVRQARKSGEGTHRGDENKLLPEVPADIAGQL